jgi:hypothetical protein
MKITKYLLPIALVALPLLAEDPTPQHVTLMKDIAAANGKIGKGEDLEASARKMSQLMKDVATFWTPKDAAAGKLATDASAAALNLANSMGDTDALKMTIGASCRGCHMAHREGPQGGPYKIK